ncbi:unnamed protein product [Chrysoparadoxa australica]
MKISMCAFLLGLYCTQAFITHHRSPLAVRGGAWSASWSEAQELLDDDDDGKKKSSAPAGAAAATSAPEGFEVVCEDGMCRLEPKGELPEGASVDAAAFVNGEEPQAVDDEEGDEKAEAVAGKEKKEATGEEEGEVEGVSELIAMGWGREDAQQFLASAGGDVTAAAEALADREEADLERWGGELEEMKEKGWQAEASMAALREADGDVSAALGLLEEEDRKVNEQFETRVEDMVRAGWDEDVARQALLAQWQKDMAKEGTDIQQKQTAQSAMNKVMQNASPEQKQGPAAAKSKPEGPPPAKREDVVFDVTDETLQKLVIESPVPVLLDVHADWCGPCKQLGPALEEAAMRSGGMFRLVKLNSDNERSTADTLGVQALPSVFAINKGQIVNNFVGIPPAEFMQAFLMGLVTGTGRGKATGLEGQLEPDALAKLSKKLAHVAGLAQLGQKKKEKLTMKVDAALAGILDGDEDAAQVVAAKDSVKVVSNICGRAFSNIGNDKYRQVSQASSVYQRSLVGCPAALEVLRLAGFREKAGAEGFLVLGHRNAAVLECVRGRCIAWISSTLTPARAAAEAKKLEPDEEEEEEEEVVSTPQEVGVKLAVEMPSGELVTLADLKPETTLREVFDALGDSVVALGRDKRGRERMTLESDGEADLSSLGMVPSARLVGYAEAVTTEEEEVTDAVAEEKAAKREALAQRMREKASQAAAKGKKSKAGSLFGDGGIIKEKKGKYREQFGGDSTVTVAYDSDDEKDEVEQAGEEEEMEEPSSSEEDASDSE